MAIIIHLFNLQLPRISLSNNDANFQVILQGTTSPPSASAGVQGRYPDLSAASITDLQ